MYLFNDWSVDLSKVFRDKYSGSGWIAENNGGLSESAVEELDAFRCDTLASKWIGFRTVLCSNPHRPDAPGTICCG
jgi:hypothetical protein